MREVLVIGGVVIVFCTIMVMVARKTTGSNFHKACALNVRALGAAVVLYAQDHDDALPPFTNLPYVSTEHDPKATGAKFASIANHPDQLKKLLMIYVASDEAWYCPSDPVAKQDVLYLGIKHGLTSYAFPLFEGANGPRRLSSIPVNYSFGLVWDAAGDRASCQPGVWYGGSSSWASNHPDGMVNFVLADLSIHQVPGLYGTHGLVP